MTRAQILRELTNKDFNPLKPLIVGKDGHLLLNSQKEELKADNATTLKEIDVSKLFEEPESQDQEEQLTKKKRVRVNGKFVKSL